MPHSTCNAQCILNERGTQVSYYSLRTVHKTIETLCTLTSSEAAGIYFQEEAPNYNYIVPSHKAPHKCLTESC